MSGGREVTGLTPAEAFPDVAGQGILERFDEVAATGMAWAAREIPVRYDRRGLGPEDTWFDLCYEPVCDADGCVVGILNFSVDVTEQVQSRREVERLLAESEAGRAALAASEARFRTVQDASPLGFCIHRPIRDAAGTVVDFVTPYINTAGARILGQPRERVMAERLLTIWPAAGTEGIVDDYARVLATGVPNVRELLYEHDELAAGLTLTAVRIGGANGELGAEAELGITFTDITARLRVERERERLLADTEAARAMADLERRRLETVLEHLPVGVHVAEAPSGRLLLDNPAVREICGEAPRSEGVNAYSADYAGHYPPGHPRAGEALTSDAWPLARALVTGTPVGEELVEIRRADGTCRLAGISAAPVRDADGRLVGAVATSVDLTEHERLRAGERDARERAERLQALTAALSAARTVADVVRVITGEGRRVFRADGAGVALLEGGGRTFRYVALEGVPADVVAEWATFACTPEIPFGHVVATREPLLFTSLDDLAARFPAVLEPSARQGIAFMVVVPLVGSDGVPLGAVHFSFGAPRDTDERGMAHLASSAMAVAQQCAQALERARLFEAEREARAEAEAANRAKGEFLAVMSHELRTPLNAIDGYAELIELGIRGPVTAEQRQDLSRIRKSQNHLLGLINGVLNYAQVEAGTVHYELESVPVEEVLVTCEALVAPQARTQGLTLRRQPCDPSLRVHADREKFQQVLLNLLSNAVKFTPLGGHVDLLCGTTPGADSTMVTITVADTGVGIESAHLARIFEPFVQVDQALSRPQQGTGLGLAISRDLARGMGGDLTVASTPGHGSAFTVRLPHAPVD